MPETSTSPNLGLTIAAHDLPPFASQVAANFVIIDTAVGSLMNSGWNTTTVPASSTATGTEGQIAWDADYVYVCTATNTWKRAALSTF